MNSLIKKPERSSAWIDAGSWAIERLTEHLGDMWPQRTWEKYSYLPAGMALAPTHSVAFAEVLELALRLELLKQMPRFVPLRRALATDPRNEQVAHLRIQLEVGALSARSGCYRVEFEPPVPGTEKRADVAITIDGQPMVVETRSVLPDSRMIAINEFTEKLFPKIKMIASRYGTACQGTVSEILDDGAIAKLLNEIETRARLVGAGMVAPPLRFSGVDLTVRPFDESLGLKLKGPRIEGNDWPRIAARLVEKAEQTKGASHVWLRFDLRQGLWQFSHWAQGNLVTKAEQLFTPLREALASYPHISGVVVSSGSLLAQGQFADDEHVSPQGALALRRLIFPHRVRETFVIPLAEQAPAQHTAAWQAFYAEELTWLDWALGRVGLTSAAEIFTD